MIARRIVPQIEQALATFPVVGIIGPRQVGKTTLTRMLESHIRKPCLFLDLERLSDQMKLAEPELFLSQHTDKCVVIDEIQHLPSLLPLLRWLVDQKREPARFIITGSSTPDLIKNNTETLAGRIAYFELTPLHLLEVGGVCDMFTHWFRGGFPLALLATDALQSRLWLDNFIETYLQRDIRALGYEVSTPAMGRLMQIMASANGNLLNLSDLANTTNINTKTLNRYLDILEGSFIIRRLTPFFSNTGKRLVKTPKIYFRDTGLLHRLLQLEDLVHLQGTIFVGPSWEAYALEQIIAAAGKAWQYDFYRTHSGAEADLVMSKPGGVRIMLEVKFSSSPVPSRGYYEAAQYLQPQHQYIIVPEGDAWWRTPEQKVCGLAHFLANELPELV